MEICKIAYFNLPIIVYNEENIKCKILIRGGIGYVNCNRSLNIHWGSCSVSNGIVKSIHVVYRFRLSHVGNEIEYDCLLFVFIHLPLWAFLYKK